MDIKLYRFSFFIGVILFFAPANLLAQPEPIALDEDVSTPVGTEILTSVRTPAYTLYNNNWNVETVTPENLIIPYYDGQLKIIVSQAGSPFFFPCRGDILNEVSRKPKKMHYGIDIQLNENDPVVACFNGKVRLVQQFEHYGKTIIIRHYNGLETIYCHLGTTAVCPGQDVDAGALIGTGGNEEENGFLHFETRFMYQPFDPLLFIDKESHKLLSDTLTLNPEEMIPVVRTSGASSAALQKQTVSKEEMANATYHIVKQGDTLYKISRLYNISVEKLLQLNHLSENSIITIGKKLRVK